MANISSYVTTLSNLTVDGNTSREVVVNCLEAINLEGPDAQTFQGLTADKYAKSGSGIGSMRYKMMLIKNKIQKDEDPDLGSENLLMTKGIIKLIGRMSVYETS